MNFNIKNISTFNYLDLIDPKLIKKWGQKFVE